MQVQMCEWIGQILVLWEMMVSNISWSLWTKTLNTSLLLTPNALWSRWSIGYRQEFWKPLRWRIFFLLWWQNVIYSYVWHDLPENYDVSDFKTYHDQFPFHNQHWLLYPSYTFAEIAKMTTTQGLVSTAVIAFPVLSDPTAFTPLTTAIIPDEIVGTLPPALTMCPQVLLLSHLAWTRRVVTAPRRETSRPHRAWYRQDYRKT